MNTTILSYDFYLKACYFIPHDLTVVSIDYYEMIIELGLL